MFMRVFSLALVLFTLALVSGCEPDEVVKPDPPVNNGDAVSFDLNQVPYNTLSEYHFFTGELHQMEPSEGVLPYEVITPLFSDYAHKKRFVWMPEGAKAEYVADHEILDFPEGAVLIKNFYYDHVLPENTRRIIETRLMYRIGAEWHFAEYIWNEAQTEAELNMQGAFTQINWIKDDGQEENINYRIPSRVECLTCHKNNEKPIPIGPKPQNLNSLYSYADEVKNQLQKWQEAGYLGSLPASIETVADWTDHTRPLEDRVRAYLDMNCAHCHSDSSHCSYRPVRFGWDETTIAGNMGLCVEPDELVEPTQQHIISPGRPERSMLYYRINSTDPATMMPLLGRTLVHQEGADLIREYIENLEGDC